MKRYICIHGHFYQPPRENPWLEEVELQESAHPHHDWNERITEQCYAPNTAARILDPEHRIIDIVNNYSRISFNFGPTLLSWIKRHKPEVYSAILEADYKSQELFSGHGSALAQVYNHMIMPLAQKKDKYTQVSWGIMDFERCFKRFPEGMWLPETAVDTQTLEILAELGLKFTLLAPSQASKFRPIGENDWIDVSNGTIDPTRAYTCQLPSGRKIALFFYDGPISQDIAFGGLLNNGEDFAKRLLSGFGPQSEDRKAGLVNIATDGETYGHHHRLGDMALAYCLYYIGAHTDAEVINYGAFLEKYPPEHEVRIKEQSSWSCVHGVQRWRDDCGCHSGLHPGWTQSWRKPMRQGLDHLRHILDLIFTEQGSKLFKSPWEARTQYLNVIQDRSEQNIELFFNKHALRKLNKEELILAIKLLEMQRHAMLMYTSCGWFFDEISGIETTQILRYADRALQLAQEIKLGDLETELTNFLVKAPSNIAQYNNGRDVFEALVKPASLDLLRVAGHYAISSLFEEDIKNIKIYCYSADCSYFQAKTAGLLKLGFGKTKIISNITREAQNFYFSAVHLGDHNVNCGIKEYMSEKDFQCMVQEIEETFTLGDVPELIRLIDKHFAHIFTLWHLFKDKQQDVINEVLQATLEEIGVSFRQIVDHNFSVMNFLQEIHTSLPKPLKVTAEFTLNNEIGKLFEQHEPDPQELRDLLYNAKNWDISLDSHVLRYKAGWKIEELIWRLFQTPHDLVLLKKLQEILQIICSMDLDIDLWKAQNIYFKLARETYPQKLTQGQNGDKNCQYWRELFEKIGEHLQVKVD